MSFRRGLGLILFTIMASVASAEEVDSSISLDSMSLEDLLSVGVVSASKKAQRQDEAPSIISVVSSSQIKDFNWRSFNEIMYRQAGFFPSRDYDRRTIGSRGLFEGWNNNHILLLIDGVPMNDPLYGTAYTWDNTPVWLAKSLEIIRGPGSALYGSNATNGFLGVQTPSGADMMGKTEVQYMLGSQKTTQVNAYTGNKSENYSYFLGYTGMQTEGNTYKSYDDSGRSGKFDVRDDRNTRYFFLKVQGEGDFRALAVQFHDQYWNFQTGHGWLFNIPDFRESMLEHRQVASVSYRPYIGDLSTEFILQYQRKVLDWNTRYAPVAPPGLGYGGGGYATTGIWEYLNTSFDNLFARAQVSKELDSKSSLLLGVEGSRFIYDGDRAHFSNTVLNDGSYAADPNNTFLPANAFLGNLKGHPVQTTAAYGQYVWGDLSQSMYQLTFGARYDSQRLEYNTGTGTAQRSFDAFSPRIAAVLKPSYNVSVKLLAGRAFRAPSPSEIGGQNTWALASNPKGLNPEKITTFEAGADYRYSPSLNLRANAFLTEVKDQIGYSWSAANLSTNIYSTRTTGAETEILVARGNSKIFLNASVAQRLDESIADSTVAISKNKVTWAPALTANLGYSNQWSEKMRGTMVASYLGKQERRSTDNAIASNLAKRGSSLDSAVVVDLTAHYQINKNWLGTLTVKNLLDKEYHFIKTRDSAFDYRADERLIYGQLQFSL